MGNIFYWKQVHVIEFFLLVFKIMWSNWWHWQMKLLIQAFQKVFHCSRQHTHLNKFRRFLLKWLSWYLQEFKDDITTRKSRRGSDQIDKNKGVQEHLFIKDQATIKTRWSPNQSMVMADNVIVYLTTKYYRHSLTTVNPTLGDLRRPSTSLG